MEIASIKMKTSTGKYSKNEVPWNKGVEKIIVKFMKYTC